MSVAATTQPMPGTPDQPSHRPPLPQPAADDARTMTVVGLAHGTSHFFHMLLPVMFPVFASTFGVSFAQLGLLVTVFYAVSGVGQALSGFAVDKYGARPMLLLALSLFVAAALVAASATSLSMLVVAALLAGAGNAPFHPVDFTILNKRVSQQRLGHAFSVHGVSGNLGWAAAPVVLIGLTTWFGSWRYAMLGAALWAVLMLALVWWQRDALDDRLGEQADLARGAEPNALKEGHQQARQTAKLKAAPSHGLAFMKLPAIWLCISFFFWSTAALSAIQSFASPAMQRLYGLPLDVTSYVVTGYMLCGALGMVLGGFIVARSASLERTIAICLSASALLLVAVGLQWLSPMVAVVVVSLAGFGTGLAGPSRDMLIKRATPPGATGRVYGTVYSGLDLGFAMAAPLFGAILDRGKPDWVFFGAALMLLAGVASASLVPNRKPTVMAEVPT
jgi:MFS transporter, FSR family, fosmidomycin resistance protein